MDQFGAATLNVDVAAAVETVFVFQPFVGQVGDLDAPRLPKRLQAAGEVYGVAPKVVGEFPASDDAGHDGAGADANPEVDGGVVSAVERVDLGHQVEGQFGDGFRMVGAGQGNAAGGHVSVADGLDLFQAVLEREQVEAREDFVEQIDHLVGADVGGERGEAHEIGHQHGDVGVVFGDVDLALLHALGDGAGERVEEEMVGPRLFGLELVEELFGVRGVADAQGEFLQIDGLAQEVAGTGRNAH